ncbi:hypothetical protein KVV02_001145 [Mortierella alpina]|uniref:Homeobox domain-containing protein n=1 Tax=Mortierella alpina TaxID=64518 RepID=A0A9P8AAS3_MORAP|nr:hypothetical protein KVV02_001145 [Mortierella alpina]
MMVTPLAVAPAAASVSPLTEAQNEIESHDNGKTLVKQEPEEGARSAALTSRSSSFPSESAQFLDYSPSLKLAAQINEINHIRTMKEGAFSTTSPAQKDVGVSATTVSAGISTLLSQTHTSASPSSTVSAPRSASSSSSSLAAVSSEPSLLTSDGSVAASQRNTSTARTDTSFSMLSPTLSSPPRPSRLGSFTDEDDVMIRGCDDATRLPMSPPLSLRFRSGDDHAKDSCQQRDQRQPKSFHPFDQALPITPPKKTLNWVNALPSHFDTSTSGSNGSNGSPLEGDSLTNSCGVHPRKRRRRTNREELEILEEAFSKNLLPDAATRQELAERLGMSVRAVQIWFQNRRQQLRKKSVSSCGGVGEAGSFQTGSEDDQKSRDLAFLSPVSLHRRSSEDSTASTSPALFPQEDGDHVPGLVSRTSPDLSSAASSYTSREPKQESRAFLRVETCPLLPSTSLNGRPRLSSSFTTPQPAGALEPKAEKHMELTTTSDFGAVVKLERVEPVISLEPLTSNTMATTPDILDAKTADAHLSMLLEEAKRHSKQGGVQAPVMAIWPGPSTKPVLNSSLSGPLPSVSTAPIAFPPQAVAHRTKSMPSIKSSAIDSTRPYQHHSLLPAHRPRSPQLSPRKHRSMPETGSSLARNCSPYPRTMSLMEQVINRQQQQQHYHQRSPPSSFKQSALSGSKGKHHYVDRTISNKAMPSSPITSNGLSAAQLARRLQHVVSKNLNEIRSRSTIQEQVSSVIAGMSGTRGKGYGQTAMRARRLSIGQYLFDSDTDEEVTPRRTSTVSGQQQQQQQQALTHQAQKRGAALDYGDQSVDGDETDEEDFIALNASKRFLSSMAQGREGRYQHQRQQDWSGTHKMPHKALKSSPSTFPRTGVTSSPTREYGLELNERSYTLAHSSRGSSPFASHQPVVDKSRIWTNGSGAAGCQQQEQRSQQQQQQQQQCSQDYTEASLTALASALPSAIGTKDLNLDELECASVLAGLGWGR